MIRPRALVAVALLWASSCCLARPAPSPEPIEPERRCAADDECRDCPFAREYSGEGDCECQDCRSYPLRRELCERYYGSWLERCRELDASDACPDISCDPSTRVACVRGRCDVVYGE